MIIASVAPSFPLFFQCTGGQLSTALRLLGFSVVEETASVLMEYHVTLAQMERTNINRNLEELQLSKGMRLLPPGIRFCPGALVLAKKEFPGLLIPEHAGFSAMEFHGKSIQSRYPEDRRIFISPCQAKAEENDQKSSFHKVLSFLDIAQSFINRGINPSLLSETPLDAAALPEERLAVLVAPLSGRRKCRQFLKNLLISKTPDKPGDDPSSMSYSDPVYSKTSVELCLCNGGCPGMALKESPYLSEIKDKRKNVYPIIRHALSGDDWRSE